MTNPATKASLYTRRNRLSIFPNFQMLIIDSSHDSSLWSISLPVCAPLPMNRRRKSLSLSRNISFSSFPQLLLREPLDPIHKFGDPSIESYLAGNIVRTREIRVGRFSLRWNEETERNFYFFKVYKRCRYVFHGYMEIYRYNSVFIAFHCTYRLISNRKLAGYCLMTLFSLELIPPQIVTR